MRKRVVVVLLALAAFLGGLLVARGYPDWSLNVIQKEGTTFVVTGQVDANITNTQIDVNVTNSTITIEPAEGSEFVIKPAQDVVFTIQGDVSITNTELNVKVTNSTLAVEVQGTANVEVQNAYLDVKTLRERVTDISEIDAIDYNTYVHSEDGTTETVYTNNYNTTVFLEYISVAIEFGLAEAPADSISPLAFTIEVKILDQDDNQLGRFVANGQMFLNFDPAFPIPPGGKIVVRVANLSSKGAFVNVGGIVRKIS